MKRKKYEKELLRLQAKLCVLQDWVKEKGLRVVVVFEGRDAAGKGGTIKAIMERTSRVFSGSSRCRRRPTARSRRCTCSDICRIFPPRARSSSSIGGLGQPAGVERVMGFCADEQSERFMKVAPGFEKQVIDGGIILIKLWLEVGNREQERRFKARMDDPLRQWKLSNMDLPSREKWYEYSRARDAMFKVTDTSWAPWFIVRSDDKRRARLNVIAHLLQSIPHKKIKRPKVKLPDRSRKQRIDDDGDAGPPPVRARRLLTDRISGMPNRFRPRNRDAARLGRGLVLSLVLAGSVAASAQAPPAQPPLPLESALRGATPAAETATFAYANRPIILLRANVLGRSPAERAAGAQRALDDLVEEESPAPSPSSPSKARPWSASDRGSCWGSRPWTWTT